jgi:hypothetical protein
MNRHRRFSPYTRIILPAAIAVAALCALLLFSPEALARVGGGQSYGGGSRGGGGSGGDGDAGAIIAIIRILLWLTIEYPAIGIPLDILLISFVAYRFIRRGRKQKDFCYNKTGIAPAETSMAAGWSGARRGFGHEFELLRRFDPNFSEIIFTDFCYALYARAHDARGRGAHVLDQFSPYLSDEARTALLQRNPPGLQGVAGIIVGSMQVAGVEGLTTPLVKISVEFESNYTELVGQQGSAAQEMTYYVRERWELERRRDVLSPPPAQATALHCPRCGAALQKDTNGACAFCGAKIESGEFQWYVRRINLLSREARGPMLTAGAEEVGTDYPSVVQPDFAQARSSFERNNPAFSWGDFQNRARLIFNELQAAWSTLNWERARPHETDNIFQMHRYWIEAYRRQRLRNILDQCSIVQMQPVKLKEDAFYNAITLRIWAQGYDYTVDEAGRVVSGSNKRLRRWSEYWTFVRSRQGKQGRAHADLNCPNCGAPLKVNMTGICQFCGGKITSGEFDWVLSKIEQDESYSG